MGRFENPVVFGLIEYHPFGLAPGLLHRQANELVVSPQSSAQLFFVGLPIGYGLFGHSRLHCGSSHRRRDRVDQAGVKGLGNDVFPSKSQVAAPVGYVDNFGHGLFSQFGNGLHRGQLHRLINLGCPHVQGPAKDVRKTQHIIDLVGVVASTRSHY